MKQRRFPCGVRVRSGTFRFLCYLRDARRMARMDVAVAGARAGAAIPEPGDPDLRSDNPQTVLVRI